MELLRNQNQLLSSHGNSALYAALGAYVELDGYYLESEPCLVCNNPEVPMASIKLPTIKVCWRRLSRSCAGYRGRYVTAVSTSIRFC